MFEINDEVEYKDYEFLNELLNKTLKQLSIDNVLFSVILIDDEEMRRINREYRNIDKTTDVLSFAFEDNAKIKYNKFRLLGDIYISIPTMKRQALDNENSERYELSFLVIHGLLHLLGYDHMNSIDKKVMFELQEALLK